jgi:hypothetical protein
MDVDVFGNRMFRCKGAWVSIRIVLLGTGLNRDDQLATERR